MAQHPSSVRTSTAATGPDPSWSSLAMITPQTSSIAPARTNGVARNEVAVQAVATDSDNFLVIIGIVGSSILMVGLLVFVMALFISRKARQRQRRHSPLPTPPIHRVMRMKFQGNEQADAISSGTLAREETFSSNGNGSSYAMMGSIDPVPSFGTPTSSFPVNDNDDSQFRLDPVKIDMESYF